jgi:hypothetical protein
MPFKQSELNSHVNTRAVLFLDILGFQSAVDAAPSVIIPVYELLASVFEACDPTGIESYIAVSDSLIISSESSETALRFALQIFLNFFYNLGEVAYERGIPVLLRGGLAFDWLTTPFAATLHRKFLKRGGASNLVGKAYSDAYILSEKLKGTARGARLRISEAVYSQVPGISAVAVVGAKGPYYEVEWPTELFREKPGLALPILKNVRRCMERFRTEPGLLGETPEQTKAHWVSTLKLLKDCAAKIQPKDTALEQVLSEQDPLL